MTDPTPGPWHVTEAEYHADRQCVSRSALEDFRRSPRLYRDRWVEGKEEQRLPTAQMDLGSALHCYLLEPSEFPTRFSVEPRLARKTFAGHQAWDAHRALCDAGATPIDEDDLTAVRAMTASVKDHPIASAILKQSSAVEQAFRWRDPVTGLWCRCKIDAISSAMVDGLPVVADVKTSSDPSEERWSLSAASFGYHRQAAFYSNGVRACLGLSCRFLFIVVGSAYPHDCHVYQLADDAEAAGHRQITEALRDLSECRASGIWSRPSDQSIKVISLPHYATKG